MAVAARTVGARAWRLSPYPRSERVGRLAAKGLSRLGEGVSGGVGFLEGDQAAGEVEEGEVVLVFLAPVPRHEVGWVLGSFDLRI